MLRKQNDESPSLRAPGREYSLSETRIWYFFYIPRFEKFPRNRQHDREGCRPIADSIVPGRGESVGTIRSRVERRRAIPKPRERRTSKEGRGGGVTGRNLACNYFRIRLTGAMHSLAAAAAAADARAFLTNGEKACSVTVAVAAA